MIIKKLRPQICSLIILCLLCSPVTPVFAQAYLGHLNALESFGIQMFQRGDLTLAQDTFERLLRIDPKNTTAHEYLRTMQTQPVRSSSADGTPYAQKLGIIIHDMGTLKEQIKRFETDSIELERIIRDLITENDDLYMALSKRTREVIDLRSQFLNLPYAKEYIRDIKQLPYDRVPLYLHKDNSDLNINYTQNIRDTRHHVERLTQDIIAIEKDLAHMQHVTTSPVIVRTTRILEEKRGLLVDKMLDMYERHHAIELMRSNLTGSNASLREIENRYAKLLSHTDARFHELKKEFERKVAFDKQAYVTLLNNYEQSLKEIDALKGRFGTPHEDLARLKQIITEKDRNIATLNARLNIKDTEIASYQIKLSEYKNQLTAQASVIENQKTALKTQDQMLSSQKERLTVQKNDIEKKDASLIYVDHQLNIADQKITIIEELIREGNTELNQLKANVQDLPTRKPYRNTSHMPVVIEKQLPSPDVKPLEDAITNLKKLVLIKDDEIIAMEERLRRSERRLARFENVAYDQDSDFLSQQENLLDLKQKLLALESQNATLIGKIEKLNDQEQPQIRQAKNTDAEFLHDLLAKRDQEMEELKAQLSGLTIRKNELTSAMANAQKDLVKLPDLQKENTLLDQEILSLKQRLAEAATWKLKAEEARQDVQSIELTLAEQKSLRQVAEAKIITQELVLNSTQNQIALLQEQLSVFEIKITAMKDVVDRRDDEIKALQDALNLSKKDLHMTHLAKLSQERLTQEETDKASLKQSLISSLKNEIVQLKEEIQNIRADLTLAHEKITRKDLDIGKAQGKMKEFKAIIERKGIEILSLKDRIAKLSHQLGSLTEKTQTITTLTAEINALSKKLKVAENQIKAEEQKTEKQEAIVVRLREELSKYESQVSTFKVNLNSLQANLNDANKSINQNVDVRTKTNQEIEKLKAVILNKEGEIADLKTRIIALTAELKTSTKTIAAKDTIIHQKSTELAKLQAQLTNNQEDISQLNDEITNIRKDLKIAHSTITEKDIDIRKLERRIVDLQAQLENKEKITLTLKEHIQRLKADLEKYENQAKVVVSLEKQVTHLSNELDATTKKSIQQLDMQEASAMSLRVNLDKKEDEASHLKNEVAAINERLALVHKANTQKELEADKALKTVQNKLSTERVTADKLQAQIERSESEVTALKAEIASIRQELTLTAKDKNLETIELQRATTNIAKLEDVIATKKDGTITLQKSLQESQNDTKRLQQEIANLNAQLHRIKQDTAQKEAAAIQSLRVAQAQVQDKDKEMDNLVMQVQKRENEISTLKSEIDAIRKELVLASKDQSAETIELGRAQGKIAKLENTIESKEQEIRKLTDRISDLKTKLKDCNPADYGPGHLLRSGCSQ